MKDISQTLYRATGIPAMQNKLLSSRCEALAAPSASLELCQDETGLVYNRCFDTAAVNYDENYQNDQGFSLQFRKHLNEVYQLCCRHLSSKDDLIVDIGCGKGGFVELLRGQGINAVGYDNTYQGFSPFIRKSFFGIDTHEQGSLLSLRHVLEHIPSPWRFLDDIAEANSFHGLLYVEVPDLEWILEKRAYFDLYHEHVNYFRAIDFYRRFGDGVIYLSKSFGGQYLSILISLDCVRNCGQLSVHNDIEVPLQTSFHQLLEYEDKIYTSLVGYDEIVLWGAASKGVLFAAKAPAAIKDNITCAIDINPSKQERYMPISGVRVMDPATALSRLSSCSLVIIMNPNYEKEIRDSLPNGQPCLVLH